MKLEVITHRVDRAVLGGETRLTGHVLEVNEEALCAELGELPGVQRVSLAVAHPGESTRIINVVDVCVPLAKANGANSCYPGCVGAPTTVGSGRTVRLCGLAVVTCAELADTWEAFIDLDGPATRYSPFSDRVNLVVRLEPRPGSTAREFGSSVWRAGPLVGVHLAAAARSVQSDDVEVFELRPPTADLPRVVAILQTGDSARLYGRPLVGQLPTLVHPNELLDGALIGVNPSSAASRNVTYFKTENPVVRKLYAEHGRSIDFAGVVIAPGYWSSALDKSRAATFAAKLAQLLHANGVVITQEGGGHGVVDIMLICQACERLGIESTVMMSEYTAPTGTDSTLVHAVPEANAIVSMGNQEEPIDLPAVQRVLGGARLKTYRGMINEDDTLPATVEAQFGPAYSGEPLSVKLADLLGSCNQLGWSRLTVRQY